MKQKLFAIGDDFLIRDAAGNDAFFVDGKVFTLGHQLSFQDMQRRELVYIRQKLLALGPTYELYRGGELVAVVKTQIFTFPDDLVAEGDFTDHEYVISRGARPVATVSKQWFALTDTYGVDVADGEDAVLLLASTVVVDMACHPDATTSHP